MRPATRIPMGGEKQLNKYERKTDRQERIPHFKQEVIRNTRVVVIGAGATGNEVLKCLALTGFGYVFIVDMDHISTSNLSRTVLFTEEDVGKKKAVIAAERFRTMNVDGGVADYFDGDLCHDVGEGIIRHSDLVIGCVDNEQTRLYVSNLCQLLGKAYIDTGIKGFDWNIYTASGEETCACYACTMSRMNENKALMRIRNSCDVTRRKASEEGAIPTIGVSASSAAALAVQEAIKISHYSVESDNGLLLPRYGWMSCFTAEENRLQNIFFRRRRDCEHHDNYANHGGVEETPMSAKWALREVLDWVRKQYNKEYAIALYKDNTCADRSFITEAHCEHCGKKIDVYRPQPLEDEDLLCEECKTAGRAPVMLSNATVKNCFSVEDEDKLQNMSLLELGIPRFHILEFTPVEGDGESLYLELTGDRSEVMPNLPY